jgi:hypothetical protein
MTLGAVIQEVEIYSKYKIRHFSTNILRYLRMQIISMLEYSEHRNVNYTASNIIMSDLEKELFEIRNRV